MVALSWLLFGALYLTLPPSPDQFNHIYLGSRWLSGDVMYVDVIDMNWPGTLAAHAAAVALFGTQLWSWRAFDLLCFAFTCLCLGWLVAQAAGRRAAWVFAALAPAAYVAFGYWMAGQHDMSAAQCMVVGLWCWVRSDALRRHPYTAVAGVFMGLAMLHKPTVGAVFLLLPAHALWLRCSWRRVVGGTGLAGTAAALTILLAAAAVVAMGTPFSALMDTTYTYNAYGRDLKPTTWGEMAQATGWWPVAVTLLCVPAMGSLATSRPRSAAGAALLVLWSAGVLSYFAQGRGQHYHLAPSVLAFIAFFAVLLASASRAWTERREPAPLRLRVGLGLGMLALVLLAGMTVRLYQTFRSLPQALSGSTYDLHLANFAENDGLTLADVSAFVRQVETTDSTGCVLSVGAGSAINVLSGRKQPTRFYYYPVIAYSRPPLPMAERWITLWQQDLAQTRCRYVLVASSAWLNEGYATQMLATQALRSLLVQYREIREIGSRGMMIYERR